MADLSLMIDNPRVLMTSAIILNTGGGLQRQ